MIGAARDRLRALWLGVLFGGGSGPWRRALRGVVLTAVGLVALVAGGGGNGRMLAVGLALTVGGAATAVRDRRASRRSGRDTDRGR